jgi:hypothetical protein
MGLARPLDVGPGELDLTPPEERLEHLHRPVLLAGRDDQRGLGVVGVDDRRHRVAHPGRRVEVDQGRPVARQGVAHGHVHHARLVQAEDVAEVGREVFKEQLLGGAGVAEHRRHPDGAEELEAAVDHGRHGSPPGWSG